MIFFVCLQVWCACLARTRFQGLPRHADPTAVDEAGNQSSAVLMLHVVTELAGDSEDPAWVGSRQSRRRHEKVAQQKLRLETVHHARARRRRVTLRTAGQNVSRYVSRCEARAVTVS